MIIEYRKKIKGFSLAEICIACGVLVTLLVPVFTLMSRSSSGTIRNRNEILAQEFVSNMISYCNLLSYDSDFLKVDSSGEITKEIGEIKMTNVICKSESVKIELADELSKIVKKKTIKVKEFAETDWPYKYKVITVTVEWQQPGETKTRNVTMSGMVTER